MVRKMKYESIENKNIKLYKKLGQKKYRDSEKLFIIEGEHLVKEALKKNVVKEILVLENKQFDLTNDYNLVTNKVMRYLTDLDTVPVVIAVCHKLEPQEINGSVIALDNIQDPGNLGTIIRSALAFNIDTILLSEDTVDLYNSKVIRASQGMLFHVNIVQTNLYNEILKLKEKGYKIMTSLKSDKKSQKNLEKKDKFVIIMGNEGNGVKKELTELSSYDITIKTNPDCESLNVAVAASIIMYELNKE